MTNEHEVKSERVNNDRTAIIVAGIAIGISLISAPGLYTLTNIPIGLVLMATLLAVDSHEDTNRFQSASFALAGALTFLVIFGLFLVNPYITNDHHVFIPDDGRPITDQLTSIEIPAIGWIQHTFGEEASDFVSFCIVGIVATFWYNLRRRLFAVHQKPPQSQDEDKGTQSSKSSEQLATPPGRQKPAMEAGSASASLASEARQRTADRMILSAFTAVMALLVYVISTREWKKKP